LNIAGFIALQIAKASTDVTPSRLCFSGIECLNITVVSEKKTVHVTGYCGLLKKQQNGVSLLLPVHIVYGLFQAAVLSW
jgi:hypothetical protein